MVPNPERCARLLEDSLAFATAYVPKIGYDRVTGIIEENAGDPAAVRAALRRAAGEE
jgi:aspartate ammonia-lyase